MKTVSIVFFGKYTEDEWGRPAPLRVLKDPALSEERFQSTHLDFLLLRFQPLRLPDETAQLGDLCPQIFPDERKRRRLPVRQSAPAALLRAARRNPSGSRLAICLLPVLLQVFQNLLTLAFHPAPGYAAPRRLTRCESAAGAHGHGENPRPAPARYYRQRNARSPAMIVFPAPGSSARRNRIQGVV